MVEAVGILRDGAVATVTLQRPVVLNAFDLELIRQLRRALAEVGEDPSVRAVVITGAGRAFCAGLDLRDVSARDTGAPMDFGEILRNEFHPTIRSIRAMAKPVIAAVNGVAAGAGLALACVCDIRVAADSAAFHPGWGRVGLAPDMGVAYFLPRLIGQGRTFELLAREQPVTAGEALRIGLVTQVWPHEEFGMRWRGYAAELAVAATFALSLMKSQLELAWQEALPAFLEFEAGAQDRAGRTRDHREGLDAFFSRRAPNFEGR